MRSLRIVFEMKKTLSVVTCLLIMLVVGSAESATLRKPAIGGVWQESTGPCAGSKWIIKQEGGRVVSINGDITCKNGEHAKAQAYDIQWVNPTTLRYKYSFSQRPPGWRDGMHTVIFTKDNEGHLTWEDGRSSGKVIIKRVSQVGPDDLRNNLPPRSDTDNTPCRQIGHGEEKGSVYYYWYQNTVVSKGRTGCSMGRHTFCALTAIQLTDIRGWCYVAQNMGDWKLIIVNDRNVAGSQTCGAVCMDIPGIGIGGKRVGPN